MVIKNLKDCPEHLNEIALWHHKEWAKYNLGQTISDRKEEYHEYLNDDFLPYMLVMLNEGKVIGTACIVGSDMDIYQDLFPWLASVFVPVESRGNGYATFLVNEVMKEAKSRGYKEMFLYTPDQQHLYAKLGWVIIEDLVYMQEEVSIMKYTFT